MTLGKIFQVVQQSNELQNLLGRNNNKVRVQLHQLDKNEKLLTSIVTDSYTALQKHFREFDYLMATSSGIYKMELKQTNDNHEFCGYFQFYKNYMITAIIITDDRF